MARRCRWPGEFIIHGMEQADYLHLVRLSELDAQENPAAYRRHVMWFAALGYAYALASVVVGALMLAGAWAMWGHGRLFPVLALGIGGLVIVWVALRALLVRVDPPQGVDITRDEAPELFRLLRKIQRKVRGPRIHRVVVTNDCNAFIVQTPRFGLFGPTHNTLGLGLPLMLALPQRRLLAVLAHEYAHLRGSDGKGATWLYRTRQTWARLSAHAHDSDAGQHDLFSMVTRGFLHWYAPRFTAKSFALARQEEYTADALAARLCGPAHTAAALIDIRLKAHHFTHHLWKAFWQQATLCPDPPLKPLAWVCAGKLPPQSALELENTLRQLRNETTHHSDTHPTTLERVQALNQPLRLPTATGQPSVHLLGDALGKVVHCFDEQWWRDQRIQWTEAFSRGQRDMGTVAGLRTRMDSLRAPELMRLADLLARVGKAEQAQPIWKEVLRLDPSHGMARWRVAMQACVQNDVAALEDLAVLAHSHPHFGLAAADEALALLDRIPFQDDVSVQRKIWRNNRQQYRQMETEAWDELEGERLFQRLQPHDLTADELADLADSARLMPQIKRLYVMLRPLNVFPYRRVFVVLVEPRGGNRHPPIGLDEVQDRLDLPGRVIVLHHDWMSTESALNARAPVGAPAYPC